MPERRKPPFCAAWFGPSTRIIQPAVSVCGENVKTTSRVFPTQECMITYTEAGKQNPDPRRHSLTLFDRMLEKVVVSAPVATEAAIRMRAAPTQEFRPVPSATW